MSALLDSLQAGFAPLPSTAADGQAIDALRRRSLARTLAEGLPTPRHERWRYTALRALSARSFVPAAGTPRVHPAVLADIPAPRLVFVNGHLDQALSEFSALPAGLEVSALSSALPAGDARVLPLFARDHARPDEAFARLNAALASDGVLLRASPGARIDEPLHLVFVGVPADGDIASHLRHAIALETGARLVVVEHHIANGTHRHLSNHFTQVSLAEGAALVHARLQDEDAGATLFARTDAVLGSGALYHRLDLELGAGLSRNEVNVSLGGAGAQLLSGGALLAGDRRHIDTRLEVEHVARDTRCDLLWRGLAAERGRVAFHGGITIQAGADGSDARLSNKNLLLSENAEIDTQPVLQIHADEVKAAHGATVGRLDADALFYLRSRGIPLAQARALLTLAFCREVLASIGDPALEATLSPRLEARLAALESVQ